MALSPMMKHYLQIKDKYKDCILFYRLGDFYEMFFDDAKKASDLLELTLTGKDCGLDERAPMCGIPFHASDVYISKLVSLGEKVAICEQLSEPNGKNLVERDVIKVVTAGTVTNNELIDDKQNNFICSVYSSKDGSAIAWADITTGEFYTKSFNCSLSNVLDSIVKISPAEIISNSVAFQNFSETPFVSHGVIPKFNLFLDSEYNFSNAEKTTLKHFNILSLTAFGIENDKLCVPAVGSLLSYLKQTQMRALINIVNVKKENSNDYLMLDINAIRNLELTKTLRDGKKYGSLLWVLDKTKTSMGARKLYNWILSPLMDKNVIEQRLNSVECLFNDSMTRQCIIELLCCVKDIERITGKVSNGNINPRDCLSLKYSLCILPKLKEKLRLLDCDLLNNLSSQIFDYSNIVDLLEKSIMESPLPPVNYKEGGFIKAGFNSELYKYNELKENGSKLISKLELTERERTGIKNLKIGYNRVFGYYIEVTNSFKNMVPYDYERRQTLTGGERYITQQLKELENDILNSSEKAINLELVIFDEIIKVLTSRISDLLKTSDAISTLDVLCSLSTVAKENAYIKPIILDFNNSLTIKDGRHPVVEQTSKSRFVPNDCILDCESNRTAIITGPNMAGKSTYMRQTALICLMAQIGSFVPASYAKIPIVDKIYTRIGASDNLILDQSTFMIEMTEVADIINNATNNSLIVLDEIGRGTSTFDGLSIAWAVVEYINNNIKAKTMFATHYHELTELEGKINGIKNYKVIVKETSDGIIFLRKIVSGGTNKSFGIEVAKLAGVNKSVTERAKEILKLLENKDINYTQQSFEIKEDNKLKEYIDSIDINNITPFEAMKLLIELKEISEKDE